MNYSKMWSWMWMWYQGNMPHNNNYIHSNDKINIVVAIVINHNIQYICDVVKNVKIMIAELVLIWNVNLCYCMHNDEKKCKQIVLIQRQCEIGKSIQYCWQMSNNKNFMVIQKCKWIVLLLRIWWLQTWY